MLVADWTDSWNILFFMLTSAVNVNVLDYLQLTAASQEEEIPPLPSSARLPTTLSGEPAFPLLQ